eukprot:SAG11_NODE_1400_length_5018_cov_2.407806_4_plen_79_part_00
MRRNEVKRNASGHGLVDEGRDATQSAVELRCSWTTDTIARVDTLDREGRCVVEIHVRVWEWHSPQFAEQEDEQQDEYV